jgi:phosphatidylserine decarboxylase
MLTPYGRDNALVMLLTGAAVMLLAFAPLGTAWSIVVLILGAAIIVFTLNFFRDPQRPLNTAAAGDDVIVAPSDGAVTEVTPIDFDADLGSAATQISIFLSPIDLHVNRYPVSGKVVRADYFPGKYLMAFNPKASTENERSEFVVENAYGRILYRQITGFLARRIVFDTTSGMIVKKGDRFGMMKFGSRMDVVVPSSADVQVRVGQRVVSADTIIARLKGAQVDQ